MLYSRNSTGYMPGVYLKRNNIPTVTRVELQDRKLHGIAGAKEIVGILKKRLSVGEITLNQNELGDEGGQFVLQYLTRNSSSLSVTTLNLNSCGLGDVALDYIATFIATHRTLQNLSLQDNAFKGDPDTVSRFVQSLNSSSIFKLDLGRNPQAGDAFLAGFLPHLHAPTLEHLNLSAMDLTPASHDIILEYLSSSSSHALRLFECNGNRLTRPFGEGLIHCLWTGNFWLKHIQLHGNFMNSLTLPEKGTVRAASAIPANPAASETHSTMRPWMVCERDMDYALHRNRLAGNFAADAAIRLLPYARILVLQLGAASQREATASRQPLSEPVLSSALPFELKALILNELAPALSLKQCHRITQYVSQGVANAATTRQAFLKTVQCDIFDQKNMDEVLQAVSSARTSRLVSPYGHDLPA